MRGNTWVATIKPAATESNWSTDSPPQLGLSDHQLTYISLIPIVHIFTLHLTRQLANKSEEISVEERAREIWTLLSRSRRQDRWSTLLTVRHVSMPVSSLAGASGDPEAHLASWIKLTVREGHGHFARWKKAARRLPELRPIRYVLLAGKVEAIVFFVHALLSTKQPLHMLCDSICQFVEPL